MNVYDFENHLIQHGSVAVTYDGDGNRVSKTAGGITTKFLVDDQNPTGFPQVVEETASDGSKRSLVYGLQRISQRQFVAGSSSPLTSFYVYDGHGSVRALTNAAGGVTDTYDYDAFGNLIHSTGSTPNEFLFAGEQFDSDLSVYYNRARYFRTSTGRFLTMDSFEGNPQSPATLHKYLYTGADPVDAVDPSGHEFDIGDIMISLATSDTLDSIASFILNSPLGNSAGSLVLSLLLPPGFSDALKILTPTAGLIGGSIGFSAGRVISITGSLGIDVLIGLGTGNVAVYGYYGPGLTLGSGISAGVTGYLGVVFNTLNSQDYTGDFFTITAPFSVIQTTVRTTMIADLELAEMSVGSAIVYIPLQFRWLILTEIRFVKIEGSINLFFDPKAFGNPQFGSWGLSVAASSSAPNWAISFTCYWQLAPPWSTFSPSIGADQWCGYGPGAGASDNVPFK